MNVRVEIRTEAAQLGFWEYINLIFFAVQPSVEHEQSFYMPLKSGSYKVFPDIARMKM